MKNCKIIILDISHQAYSKRTHDKNILLQRNIKYHLYILFTILLFRKTLEQLLINDIKFLLDSVSCG